MFITKLRSITMGLLVSGVLALVLAWSTAPQVAAQQAAGAQADEAAGEASSAAPLIKDYKGVRLGMTADEARKTLGGGEAVKEKRDVFMLSDNEMAQLYFDKDGKLQAVSVTYLPKGTAPTAAAVLGADVPAGADGRVYKLIRYPEAGYWVSYNRTAGDAPVVTVTMTKMSLVQQSSKR
jgi:hypothetical protein